MKSTLATVLLAASTLAAPATALALDGESPPSERPVSTLVADFNFLLGQKYLNNDDWGILDEQLLTGLESTWRGPTWPVGVAFDGMFSNAEKRRNEFTQEETVTRASTLELGLGLRAIVPFGRVRPYVGGGAAVAQGDIQTLRRNEADEAAGAGGIGWWACGGVFLRVGQTANVGLAVRWSQANVKSGSFDANAGGMAYALTAGFGIPPFLVPED